jgi:predicted dehydrogenase
MVGIGLVGYGYWGPNLGRNFSATPGCRFVAICDQSSSRLEGAGRQFPACLTTTRYEDLLVHPGIDAIAIATPAATHFELARQALVSGKDVLVEKPMTTTAAASLELIELADRHGRILAVDHTFLYTDAVRKIKELLDAGEIGDLLYMDSVRTNLGLFQRDHNVIWDLAPHELSIVLNFVPEDPISVQALGACHAGNGIENLAYVHLEFPDNLVAHFHLNWLAPVKIRQTIVAGSRKMIVYDDMERSEKIKIYDKGIAVEKASVGMDELYKACINYRSGDMTAPHLNNREALAVETSHFVQCVRDRERPIVDGLAGLRVVRLLEAAEQSLRSGGQRVALLRSAFPQAPGGARARRAA